MVRVGWVSACLWVFAALGADAQVSPGVSMAGLAAEVRGEPITRYELEAELADRMRRLQTQYDAEQLTRELPAIRWQTLQDMIITRLVIHECDKRNITATGIDRERLIGYQIEEQLKRGIQVGGTEEYYRLRGDAEGLTREQIDEDLNEEVRQQKLLGQLLSDNFVSPNELRRHYDSNPDLFTTEASYRFRHILVSRSDMTTLRERLDAIDSAIKERREFEVIARTFSEGPRADRGGLYEVTDATLNDWLDTIARAVRSLGEGEISPRIVSSQGVHYIKLEKRTSGDRLSFEEAQRQIERAILIQRRQARYVEFVSQLQEDAKNDIRVYIDAPPGAHR